ncbi:hypothetical protein, partial [Mesorhizobium sp. M4B.F.Ca.ET.150.01.1.1]|uniref:hypothetical protein n=1 Tax=Mesorhizobium sp. M4B.F.Ca.ET.150.01.1.1 TaxID=2563948 RepID=UPI001AEEB0FE
SKAPGRAGRFELQEICESLCAAHKATGGKHDIGDEHDPHRRKRNERKKAKSGKKADDGDDQRDNEHDLGGCTEIHV